MADGSSENRKDFTAPLLPVFTTLQDFISTVDTFLGFKVELKLQRFVQVWVEIYCENILTHDQKKRRNSSNITK